MVPPCLVGGGGSSLLLRQRRTSAGGKAAVPTIRPKGLLSRSQQMKLGGRLEEIRMWEKKKQRNEVLFVPVVHSEDTLEPMVYLMLGTCMASPPWCGACRSKTVDDASRPIYLLYSAAQ